MTFQRKERWCRGGIGKVPFQRGTSLERDFKREGWSELSRKGEEVASLILWGRWWRKVGDGKGLEPGRSWILFDFSLSGKHVKLLILVGGREASSVLLL